MSIRFAGDAGHAGHVPPTREVNRKTKYGTGKTSPASPASPADRSAPESGRGPDHREFTSVLAVGVRRFLEGSRPDAVSCVIADRLVPGWMATNGGVSA